MAFPFHRQPANQAESRDNLDRRQTCLQPQPRGSRRFYSNFSHVFPPQSGLCLGADEGGRSRPRRFSSPLAKIVPSIRFLAHHDAPIVSGSRRLAGDVRQAVRTTLQMYTATEHHPHLRLLQPVDACCACPIQDDEQACLSAPMAGPESWASGAATRGTVKVIKGAHPFRQLSTRLPVDGGC